MRFVTLPENPHRTLEALAIYRYLTSQQISDLGLATTPTVVRDHILKSHLKKGRSPLVKSKDFGLWPGYGKLPHIHYMTPEGANYLADYSGVDVDEIRYPKGGVQYRADFFHRLSTIDCHIALRKWAAANDLKVNFSHLYFDKTGSQRGSGPKQVSDARLDLGNGGFIVPDIVTCFNREDYILPLVLEVHRHPDTKEIAQQLQRNATAIYAGAMAAKYDLPINNLVLSVHEKPEVMKRVMTLLMQIPNFENYIDGFLFNTVEQVKTDITQGWAYANMKPTLIFAGQ